MEFFELIEKRYSVRSYKAENVEEDKLLKVLHAARLAPTAANRQPFQIVVVHTEGRKVELARLYHREWFTQAPLLVAVCGEMERGWVRDFDGVNYTYVDAAIVMDHLTLAACDLGLGTCWVAHFNPRAAREILALPANVEPIALTPLGYPADQPKPKVRKELKDLVRYERW